MGTHPIFESDFDCLTVVCSPLGVMSIEEIDYIDVTFGSGGYLHSEYFSKVFVYKQATTPLVTLVQPKGIGNPRLNQRLEPRNDPTKRTTLMNQNLYFYLRWLCLLYLLYFLL